MVLLKVLMFQFLYHYAYIILLINYGKVRLIGNIILTLLTRINCRNFELTDVVNGYLGVKSSLLKKLDFKKISKDFFFEEDLLYFISFYEKKIIEIPIKTFYFEKSSLTPLKTILPFLTKHIII